MMKSEKENISSVLQLLRLSALIAACGSCAKPVSVPPTKVALSTPPALTKVPTSTLPEIVAAPNPVSPPLSEEAEEALRVLNAMPTWTEITDINSDSAKELMDSLERLSQLETKCLREAVVVLAANSSKPYDLDQVSKIYLLNRYCFRTPEGSINSPVLGGWVRVPSASGGSDYTWPLEAKEDGSLRLADVFHGFSGPPYDALREFDYMSDNYARRDGR